jgi:boron transporter
MADEKCPVSTTSYEHSSDTGGEPRQSSSIFRIKVGAGIVRDIRARAPWYWSDWKDAWNYRVVPATTLVFFAK